MSRYVLGTKGKKYFFLIRTMERLSSLNVSFGTHDDGIITAAKAVLFHCSMIFLNFLECILLMQQRHIPFCPKDH
jgi:hypothetical protein